MAYQWQCSRDRAPVHGGVFLKKAMSGLRAWTFQRLTAVYMLVFCGYVLLRFSFNRPHSFREWHAWFASPAVLLTTALFFVVLSIHIWVGLRDVIMDYVHSLPLRVCLFSLLGLEVAAMVCWTFWILLSTQN
jgi:succinate dehydrogenase / fumarate reductase membrane anchor subunit